MSDIIPAGEAFPNAMVPGAQTMSDVLAVWKLCGLKPVQITDGDQLQRITLTHDPLRGELKWETQGPLDGLLATEMIANAALLMPAIITADGALSIAEYFTRGPGQLDLGTGEAGVVVVFKEGRMALDWEPKDAPIAAKKLLAAALLFMVARDAGLPIERLLAALGMT